LRPTRAETTRYEAVALSLFEAAGPDLGNPISGFPPAGSPLLLDSFFDKLYDQYDKRFVFAAPALTKTTQRVEWAPESPVFEDNRVGAFNPRIGESD
jgi:hypothetical protein